jgi:hypothetical protein
VKKEIFIVNHGRGQAPPLPVFYNPLHQPVGAALAAALVLALVRMAA